MVGRTPTRRGGEWRLGELLTLQGSAALSISEGVRLE